MNSIIIAVLNALPLHHSAIANMLPQKLDSVLLYMVFILLGATAFQYYKRVTEKKTFMLRFQQQAAEIAEQRMLLNQNKQQNKLLVAETHHRVKNNLQLAVSLLNMQLRGTTDKAALSSLQEIANRLHSMLLVHHDLYDKDDMEVVDMKPYTQNLLEHLLQSYASDPYKIIPSISIANISLSTSQAIPVGLMLTELITNSLKYAIPIAGLLQINISLQANGSEGYTLQYMDNGLGLPSHIDIKKTKTMGLRLMRELTKQLKGDLAYAYNGSSIFTITFPNHQEK